MRKRFFSVLTRLFLLLMPWYVIGQAANANEHVKLLSGQTYYDSLHSSQEIVALNVKPGFEVNLDSIGVSFYKISVISQQPGFTGQTSFSVKYFDNNKPFFKTYFIEYSPSVISCKDDYVSYQGNNTISVKPMDNDATTSGGLHIAGLGNVSGGSAWFSNDSIFFDPDASSRKGFVLYAVKDSSGSTSNALVHFIKEIESASDTIEFTLLNTQKQTIYLSAPGFAIETQPTKGSITSTCAICFTYNPLVGASGQDIIRFQNASDQEVLVKIKLVNKTQNLSSVRDDVFFTPKNTPLSFNVFDNDLSDEFPINQYSAGLIPDPNVPGKFSFNPPTGFQGVRNFTYRVNYGSWTYTGKVQIRVGNYQPQEDLVYDFVTLKNTPLIISYDVPIDQYNFTVLDQPEFGTVEISSNDYAYPCNDTFYTEKVYIKYSPDNAFFGNDTFDISYYLTNGDSFIYKIYVEILNPDENIDCPCVVPDCVRKGDLDGNGKVSVSDILPLARFMSFAGKERSDHAHSDETGTMSEDWGIIQPSGADIKHIDANGDGVITMDDTTAVDYNYGRVHTLVPREVLSVKDFPFSLTYNQDSYEPGDLMIIDFIMGTEQKPALDVFGIAFGLNIQPGLLDSSSVQVDFENDSWFSYSSPMLNFWKQPKSGKLEIAHATTGGIVVDELEGFKPKGNSGFGKLGTITGIVVDELEGFKGVKNTKSTPESLKPIENRAKGGLSGSNSGNSYTIKNIATSWIELEDIYGQKFLLPDTFIQIKVLNKKSLPTPTEDKLLVYPNPARDILNLHFNGRNLIHGYNLYDSRGQLLHAKSNVLQQSLSVETHNLMPGMYILQVQSQAGTITRKVIIH